MDTNKDVVAMLCRRIKATRIEKNLSQVELAIKARVGIATIKRVEQGESITLLTLIAILRGLDELDQLNNLLVHREPKLIAKHKLTAKKQKLAAKLKTTELPELEDDSLTQSEYGFISAHLNNMHWRKT